MRDYYALLTKIVYMFSYLIFSFEDSVFNLQQLGKINIPYPILKKKKKSGMQLSPSIIQSCMLKPKERS